MCPPPVSRVLSQARCALCMSAKMLIEPNSEHDQFVQAIATDQFSL